MATGNKLVKRETDNEIEGFLQNVSPIKTSKKNNLYFDGTIQTGRTEYKHFVCFDTNKQSAFAAADKSPVKLKDISLTPSQREANSSDVIVKKHSTMEIKKNVDFPYKIRETPTSTMTTVANCLEMPAYNKVSLIAKVIKLGTEDVKDVRGNLLLFRKATISDETASITLTLWDDHTTQVEPDKVYIFTDLSTRVYDGHTLTSTPSTTINMSEKTLNIETMLVAYKEDTVVVATVSNIVLNKNVQCSNCKKTIGSPTDVPQNSTFVRCTHCLMKQNTKDLIPSFHGKLNVQPTSQQGHQIKLTVFSSPLSIFLTKINKVKLLEDVEDLEEFFLTTGPFQFTYSSDFVIDKIILYKKNDQSVDPQSANN